MKRIRNFAADNVRNRNKATVALHNETGKWGERVAQRHLLLHGYHIRDINWKVDRYELDIVAEKLGFLVFVEVRTRTSDAFVRPEDTVDRAKIRRLLAASNAYVHYYNLDLPVQHDIITIVGSPDDYHVNHIKHAFDERTPMPFTLN